MISFRCHFQLCQLHLYNGAYFPTKIIVWWYQLRTLSNYMSYVEKFALISHVYCWSQCTDKLVAFWLSTVFEWHESNQSIEKYVIEQLSMYHVLNDVCVRSFSCSFLNDNWRWLYCIWMIGFNDQQEKKSQCIVFRHWVKKRLIEHTKGHFYKDIKYWQPM